MLFWPKTGSCCCTTGGGGITVDPQCPCPTLPSTLYLTFSRQLAGIYEDATLIYGPWPAGWTVVGSTDNRWWSAESFTVTYYTTPGFFTTATKTFKYAFWCYPSGSQYRQRVHKYFSDGTDWYPVETYIYKDNPFTGPPLVTGGTIACDPFLHTYTLTSSFNIHDNLDERPRMNTAAKTLVTPINYTLSE